MVAPTRTPAHLGAPRAPAGPRRQPPAGRAPQARAAARACAGPSPRGARSSRPESPPGGRGVGCGRGRGVGVGDSASLAAPPPPGTSSELTSDASCEPPVPEQGGGAARMNGACGCSLATPGRFPAALPGRVRRLLPLARDAGLLVAGRPQPTVPSAGVTHSRRSASSPRSRAHRESPRQPARRGPSSAPGTPPSLPPGPLSGARPAAFVESRLHNPADFASSPEQDLEKFPPGGRGHLGLIRPGDADAEGACEDRGPPSAPTPPS
ncbi:uncharacterized protein LOC110598511 [Ictidomys tridecemlineatus]